MRPDPIDTVRGVFATTHWTVVLGARESGDGAAVAALGHLCKTYWPPLYTFLRRQGHAPHDAQDLVQGFFEQFLDRGMLRVVDPDKGRFRSFLLASLRNYVANQQREERTQRRGGRAQRIPLDEPGVLERCEADWGRDAAPEMAFDRVWAETIMSQAARRLREEYESRGRRGLYETLCRWLASEAAPGEYAIVAPSIGLTETALAAAVYRLRQRFRELIREEVGHTVQTPDAIPDEVQYLLKVLTAT